MQRPRVPPPIGQQIDPKNGIPLHRPKGNPPLPLLITVHKPALTPPPIPRRIHNRKISPATRGAVVDRHVREETRQPVPALPRRRKRRVSVPVRVEVEVLARAVPHQLNRLQLAARHVEALEGQRAVLDAAHHRVPRHVGALRGADAAVAGLGARYAGVGEGVFAGRR